MKRTAAEGGREKMVTRSVPLDVVAAGKAAARAPVSMRAQMPREAALRRMAGRVGEREHWCAVIGDAYWRERIPANADFCLRCSDSALALDRHDRVEAMKSAAREKIREANLSS